jgi:YfiH family protein
MKKIQPSIFNLFSELVAVESTRQGGVSKAPFSSLNLGNFTEDNAADIHENRRLLLTELGFEMANFACAKQVHGNQVLHVTAGGTYEGYDALMTNTKSILLGITVADCTPILIYDAKNQAIAAIHAGWRGTVASIITETLNAMRTTFGTKSEHCFAYIGTCIDLEHFEVGIEVAAQFEPHCKQWNRETEKFHVDLKQANKDQLLAAGVPENQIEVSPFSTIKNVEDYFSFRAENGVTGRFMVLIGLKV